MPAIGRRRWSRTGLLCSILALAAAGACRRSSLLPRADGAAVVVAAAPSLADQGVAFVAEVEPNDTLAAAQKLAFPEAPAESPALGVNGRLDATAGKARDVDLFRLAFAPAAGDAAATALRRRLSVEVTPDATLAVTVDALDDQGQALIDAAGGAAGEADGFPNLSVGSGVYFVRVRAASGTSGAYRLVARLSSLEAGEEQEPNGKAALASEAPAGGELVGYHGWRHDQDWYRVPLAAAPDGSVLAVDLEAVPGVAASLLIFDAAERKLLESRGRTEERVAVRNLRPPPGDPQLFVVVRTDAGRNAAVRYDLRLRFEVPKAGGELEPNDDPAHAQAIGDGDTLGFLGRGDVDVYRYTPPPGPSELDIELAPPERVDAKLEVIRDIESGTLRGFPGPPATDSARAKPELRPREMVLFRADAGRRHESERIPNLYSPGGGAFLIRLSAGKSDGNPDEPYRLTIASRPAPPGAEREPNGTAASATPLPPGVVGNGLLYPRGDVDFWRVPAAPAGSATITVTGVAGLVLDVRVQANDERELGRFKVAGPTPTPFQVATGGAGCCLIQIRDASAKSAAPNPIDRYALAVGP